MKRRIRKFIGLVLCLSIVLSTFTLSAAAAESSMTSGKILKALGLVEGNQSGDLMENETITRAEAAQIVCKIMNWPLVTVSSYTYDDWTWAKQQAATLAKYKISNGIGNNKFGGDVKMDLLQVYSWIYAAITGDSASAFANPDLLLKILPKEQVSIVKFAHANGINAKRSEIFDGMKTILTSEQTDGKTQLDKLITAGVVQESVALSLGLKTDPTTEEPTEPEIPTGENLITSVELINYKEVKVVFSVAASSEITYYKFNNVNAKVVTLSSDKKEAIVMLATTLKPQEEVTFNYVNGSYKYEKKLSNYIDSVLPRVVEIKTTNKGQLTLVFSEAIDPTSNIILKVNNGMYYAAVDKISANGREVIVMFQSAVDGQSYTIAIDGAKDYAGYKMAPQSFVDYKYQAIKVPVTVKIKEASSNLIILTLSSPTVITQSEINGLIYKFRHVSLQPVVDAILQEGGKEIKLVLADGTRGYPAPGGNWNLVITDANKIFVDSWGNTSQADITLPFTVVIDKVTPTVLMKYYSQVEEKITLQFSEAVIGADSYSNYEIIGADGKVIYNAFKKLTPIVAKDNKEFTLAIDKEAFISENCTLVIKKGTIKDNSYNTINEDVRFLINTKYMRLLTATAKAVRSKSDASKTNKIYVTYSNDMLTDVTVLSNWRVSSGEISSITFNGTSRKEIVITLKADITIAGIRLETSAVKDVSDNTLGSAWLSYTFPILTNADIVGNTTKISAIATDTQSVQVIVEGRVTAGYQASAFEIGYIGSTIKTVTAGLITNIETKIIDEKICTVIYLGIPEQFKLSAQGYNSNKQVELTIKGLVLNDDVTVADTTVVISDGISPSVIDVVSKSSLASSVVFSLTEIIDNPLNSYLSTELVVTYAGKLLMAGIDYEAAIVRDQLIISLKTKTNGGQIIDLVAKNSEVSISLSGTSKYIKDSAGNALKPFAKTIILD
ncbi:MAG: outer cell wall protein precursor [Clostridiales bacterium]|jgi:hypothetical protein|nr:outer cell wall protein precursor [Clostridiales bacterium]